MHIHFVTEKESQRWVLLPIAEALTEHLPGATLGDSPRPGADVNFFINYALYEPMPGLTTALFTHREGGRFDLVAGQVNWCFAMSVLGAILLPIWKTTVLPLYPHEQFNKGSLVLGVVGRGYKSGRKRMHWISDLRAISGVQVKVTDGKVSWNELPAFYDSIDYLVVLSDNEGGPLPVLEALAMSKPVIAPNVGFCWEHPVLRYTTKEDLLGIVSGLAPPSSGWGLSAQIVKEILEQL